MDSYEYLPDMPIEPLGPLSNEFLERNITSFKGACMFVHDLPYEYNSNYDDHFILFKEMHGSCTSKHAVIAGLAQELKLSLYKSVGIYRFTEEIADGAKELLQKYSIPYIPMIHCFLVYNDFRFDLTEGNHNGKKKSIEEFIYTEVVDPFITTKDEYLLFRKTLKDIILPSPEMEGTKEVVLLKAREKGIALLKKIVKKQNKLLD